MAENADQWRSDACEAFKKLSDPSYEDIAWDSIDSLYRKRTDFAPKEVACALEALSLLTEDSGAVPTALHILHKADRSGQLLTRGLVLALQSSNIDVMTELLHYAYRLPRPIDRELCIMFKQALNREHSWVDWMFGPLRIVYLLFCCATPRKATQ